MSAFNGTWQNQYGSKLTLYEDTGFLQGTYQSSTGSTGEYYVIGFGSRQNPTTQNGVGICLSILWRSFVAGTPDPSWHWVSGFGGQLILQSDGTPNIIFNHDLVATDDFAGVGNVGSYLDKLIYTPYNNTENKSHPPKLKDSKKTSELTDPVNGFWKCKTPALNLKLFLELMDENSGLLYGSLQLNEENLPVFGFADNKAKADGLKLEGVSFCVATNDGKFMAFSGWMNMETNELVLLQQISRGTASDIQYMQTSARTVYMGR